MPRGIPNKPTDKRKSPTKVNVEQRLRLYEWLKTNATQELVNQHYRTYGDIARIASEQLGFKIADSTIAEVLKYLGVKTRGVTRNGHGPGNEELLQRVETLEQQVRALWAAIPPKAPINFPVPLPNVMH